MLYVVTTKGDEIVVSGVANERRALTRQHFVTFDRAACDLLLERTRLWHVGLGSQSGGLRVPSRITSLGGGTLLPYKELVEFLQHEDITGQFFVAHFRGRALLFNKHTFELDIEVRAVHIPTDKAYCCGLGI